jgi:hypothetical protein
MRTRTLLSALFASAVVSASTAPADSTGLPGDHFSLEGALDLFKESSDLETFERALNEEANHVNNLDLNHDGKVDYVRVESHKENNAFAIVMQVAVSKEEAQDVAVIELEKTGDANALVQIRGNEDLYGPEKIVEPYSETEGTKAPRGPSAPDDLGAYVTVNVWAWPCVQWCYGPSFNVWISPWYWDYYPGWWSPWYCMHWGHFHHYHAHYHGWYHYANVCHVESAHALYGHHRKASVTAQRNVAVRKQQRVIPKEQRVAGDTPRNKPMVKEQGRSDDRKVDRSKPTTKPGKVTPPRTKPSQPGKTKPSRNTGGGGSKRRTTR